MRIWSRYLALVGLALSFCINVYHVINSFRESEALQWSELVVANTPSVFSAPLQQPLTQSSTNGVLSTKLHLSSATLAIGPVTFQGLSYSGSHSPGPTLLLNAGDALKIDLINGLEMENDTAEYVMNTSGRLNHTNLHLHGLHVSPSGSADNMFVMAAPGDTLHYEYEILNTHAAGTFYYHPHLQGSSLVQTLSGMAGALIVKDAPGSLPPELAAMNDIVVILQEVDVGKLQKFIKSNIIKDLKLGPVTFFSVNGQYQPIINVAPGQSTRIRFIHGGAGTFIYLQVYAACQMVVIARDGVYLSAPRLAPGVLLSPGSRADVILKCTEPGTHRLYTGGIADGSIHHYLGADSPLREETVAFIQIAGKSVDMPLPTWLPSTGRQSLLDVIVPDEKKFVFEFNEDPTKVTAGNKFYAVNGQLYDPSVVQRRVTLDEVEEWVIVNEIYGTTRLADGGIATEDNHPFHMHVNHYQVVDSTLPPGINSPDWQVGDWRDTISVLAPGNVTIRFIPQDYTGLTVAHCHLFSHSDVGMVAVFEIIDPQ